MRPIDCPGAFLLVVAMGLLAASSAHSEPRVVFGRAFAPQEGLVAAPERAQRAEICLNGSWQFQPMALPPGFRHGGGATPELPLPRPDAWDAVPIRIPSPWNVNQWGPGRRGRDVGEGTSRLYEPDSEFYPSYPAAWDGAEMGWLRRSFRVPADWAQRRVLLHFEAVAGEFQVLLNGRLAGEHFDSHLPAEFDVTALVRRDGDNELLVGVRHPRLFDRKSARYDKFAATYPPGSNTDNLVGIWQDVYLLGLPAVRVDEVFVQPDVAADTLTVVTTLRNDSAAAREFELGGDVRSWINHAGADTLSAPEPNWSLGDAALSFPAQRVTVPAGGSVTTRLSVQPGGRLREWSPSAPNLYGLLLSLKSGGELLDTRYERFGWRQITLAGREVRLNGKPIQMVGDLCHPFGAFMMSRRFAWAWYKLIKDVGGNAVRPHAQPYPRYYLDLADEMGLLVLDETAAFGSSIRLNPEAPEFWTRFAAQYEGLIRRDRNHPSVLGWSCGNEMFAIPRLNTMSAEDTAAYYDKLAALALRAREWDPTRPWISCDGDEDLNARLPVWSKHYGHGLPDLPRLDKPQMVGESGGTYYARPEQLVPFAGERAYESYAGRNEALAVDLYQNLVQMARPKLAYFSPSELVWFGLEPLPYGRSDFGRVPTLEQGVFFGPFREGRPGYQPERIPPYCGTLNPGWDASLPLYRPLAMVAAMKAALDPRGPQPSPWDHLATAVPHPTPVAPTITGAAMLGSPAFVSRLTAWGVPLGTAPAGLTLIDAESADPAAVKLALAEVAAKGGLALVLAGRASDEQVSALLPLPVRLADRAATLLRPDREHPWTAPFALPRLYFAEDGPDRFIARRTAAGPFVERGRVLLSASDTDWSLFNNMPENAKCGATMLYEQLVKPGSAVLVTQPLGQGSLVLSTLDWRVASAHADTFWRKLLGQMGLVLGTGHSSGPAAFEGDVLVRALAMGRLAETDTVPGGGKWVQVETPNHDRFVAAQLGQTGPEHDFAVYYSFQLNSPRALDDLLLGGPDAPRVGLLCYAGDRCRVWLNGKELHEARTEAADTRTLSVFEGLALRKGPNRVMIQVVSAGLDGSLAVRLTGGPIESEVGDPG